MFHLEALTISVNYSEYLERIISNRKFFDRWVVMTSEKDEKTLALCAKHDIEAFPIKNYYEMGKMFPKGRIVNEGFTHLSKDTWIIHIDSDILLPEGSREIIENECVDKEFFYTVTGRFLEHEQRYKENVFRCEGFFQLFHSSEMHPYGIWSDDAGWDDCRFVKYWWDKKKACIIPGLIPIHFGPINTNWLGKKQ